MNSTTHRRPPVFGSLGLALSSLPLGILGFTVVVTLFCLSVPLMITVIGVPVVLLATVLWRGLATLERARVYGLLDAHIDLPYRAMPQRWTRRWRARLADPATWRDAAYLVLLLPLGIVEFVVVTVFWVVGIGYLALPVYFRFLPGGGYFFPDYSVRWIIVDSTLAALPWMLVGVALLAIAIPLTRGLARLHTALAVALLGPRTGVRRQVAPATAELVAG